MPYDIKNPCWNCKKANRLRRPEKDEYIGLCYNCKNQMAMAEQLLATMAKRRPIDPSDPESLPPPTDEDKKAEREWRDIRTPLDPDPTIEDA